ncbi:MAG: shikimate kinase [Slackia sp.]|nr:shikimate kinase [Slackia sp.]
MAVLTKNVFLIGFMGVGKTTVARRLARDMGVASIDVDAYMHRKHGKDANQLFKQRGEKGLRRAEAQALAECASMGPAVISCGEGIVALARNRELIERTGFAVLLESSAASSLARVKSLRTRPLLAHGCDTDLLWDQRKPLYDAVACVTVDVRDKGTAAVACEIASLLQKRGIYRP